MDIEEMRTFLSVARNRSISKAAHELFATQPTVSVRIKRLEHELGFPVLTRSWRGVELTPQGHHILPTIADHLIRLETAMSMAADDAGHSGVPSIMSAHAAPRTVAVDDWLVGAGISELVRAIAGVDGAFLTVTDAARLRAMVTHGVCSRGVTYATAIPSGPSAHETELWREPFAIVHAVGNGPRDLGSHDAIREFFASRRFVLMDDPVFTEHAGITGPMLREISPLGAAVVDDASVMASMCTMPDRATIVPGGLCRRNHAFSQPGVEWAELDDSWGRLPVVMTGEDDASDEEIDRVILTWAEDARI